MCGHGTIGTITIGIEEGSDSTPKVPGKIRMEAPAGLGRDRLQANQRKKSRMG